MWALTLTGGEPTLHPELVRLVHKLRALRFRRRQMITNGFRLTRNLVMELNAAALTDLRLSIDGVRRTPTTVKVLDGLGARLDVLARHARFRVTVSAVIGSAPLAEARAVIVMAPILSQSHSQLKFGDAPELFPHAAVQSAFFI